ncbi:MAG TPA: hypothetical protein VGK50_08240 [Coriobacteriia bacterium]
MTAASRGRAIAFVAALAVLSWTAAFNATAASAVEPTVTATGAPYYGVSSFTYSDLFDVAPKHEGGYAAFNDTSTLTYADPHGGYDTATNKCSICHAVHRTDGSYFLMRGENQADACMYCHGPSGHARRTVYDANPGGMSTSVGHRIGASPVIPASGVTESLETTTLASTDASGNVTTATIQIRSVGAANRIFRLQRTHTQNAAGEGRLGYQRVGPTPLGCLSCHQPHNAPDELWRPRTYPYNDTVLAGGYKLLRASPSGSIQGTDDMPYGGGGPATVSYTRDGMVGYKAYTNFATTGLVNNPNAVRSVESTLTAANTGPGSTIWVTPDPATRESADATTPARATNGIDQYALSVWCADCHNLAIGNFRGNASTTTTTTNFPGTPNASNDAAVSTTETAFTQVKQLTVDITGVSELRVLSDLKVDATGTADMRVDVAGTPKASHTTTATAFTPFTDMIPVSGSGNVNVTLFLHGDGGSMSNQTFEVFLGTEQTRTSLLFADLMQPAHETSRTHTAPMAAASNGPGQCYTCHRGGLSPEPASPDYAPSKAPCERCHYGTGSFASDPTRAPGSTSDWPHSAEASAAYMLGAWTVDASGSVVATSVTQEPAVIRQEVCRRCHVPGSRTHTSTPSP